MSVCKLPDITNMLVIISNLDKNTMFSDHLSGSMSMLVSHLTDSTNMLVFTSSICNHLCLSITAVLQLRAWRQNHQTLFGSASLSLVFCVLNMILGGTLPSLVKTYFEVGLSDHFVMFIFQGPV